jgi:hypothetical protein
LAVKIYRFGSVLQFEENETLCMGVIFEVIEPRFIDTGEFQKIRFPKSSKSIATKGFSQNLIFKQRNLDIYIPLTVLVNVS